MKFECPICKGELMEQAGNQINPGDEKYGITVYCPHVTCPAKEVSGHGKTSVDAFNIIQEKFNKRKVSL